MLTVSGPANAPIVCRIPVSVMHVHRAELGTDGFEQERAELYRISDDLDRASSHAKLGICEVLSQLSHAVLQNFRGLATPVCARAVSPSTPR
jgi:hypothetical protein